MRYLVTGVAGFIGFHVAKALIKRGDAVIGIDNISDYYSVNLKRDRLKELGNKIKFYEGDISDFDLMNKIFEENNFDKIIHLAAQAGVRYSLENPFEYEKSNGLGTLTIFELAKRHNVKDVVYASSSSVYGGNKKVPFSVNDEVNNPISMYAATKKYSELLAHSYSRLYNINFTGLRFFTVYGPWGRPDMSIYKFTKAILEDKKIELYNHRDHIRDFTYIDDVVKGIMLASDKNLGCNIYNLGNNKPIELMKIVDLIETKLNKVGKKEMLPMQKGDVHMTYADIDLTTKNIGWLPETTIEDGISKFIDWYKKYNNLK